MMIPAIMLSPPCLSLANNTHPRLPARENAIRQSKIFLLLCLDHFVLTISTRETFSRLEVGTCTQAGKQIPPTSPLVPKVCHVFIPSYLD